MTESAFSKRYAKFLELLIEARVAAGMTQAEVAEKLGKPQSFVSKYENGERRIDVVELVDISDILGLDVAGLVSRVRRIRDG